MAARIALVLGTVQFLFLVGCSGTESHEHVPKVESPINADTAYARRIFERAEMWAREARYDSAMIYFELASTHFESSSDWSRVVYSKAAKGRCFINIGEFREARRVLKEAVEIGTKYLAASGPALGEAYSSLGRLYSDEHMYEPALKAHEKALGLRIAAFGDQHRELAESYSGLAFVYLSTGDYHRAERLFEKALELLGRAWNEDQGDVAAVYTDLGYLYTETGKYDQAVEVLEQALRINRGLQRTELSAVPATLKNLGEAYRLRGDYARALEAHQEALRIAENDPTQNPRLFAAILNNLGIVHVETGNPEAAISFYERSLNIRQALGVTQKPAITSNLNNLGVAHASMGDYDRGLRYLESGLRIRRELFGESSRAVAVGLNNIGGVLSRKGEYERARDYYEEALSVFIAAVGEQHPYVANAYKKLGLIMNRLGAHREALLNLEKSLEIFRSTSGQQDPYVATAYSALGATFDSLGETTRALDFHRRALQHRVQKHGEHHALVASHHNDIGNIYGQHASFDRALEAFKLARLANQPSFEDATLAAQEARQVFSDQIWLQSLWGLSRTLRARAVAAGNYVPDLEEAHDIYHQAAQTLDRMHRRYRSQDDRLHWVEVAAPLMSDAVDVSFALYEATGDEKYKSAAFYFAEKSKGSVLLGALSEARARRFADIPDSLLTQERSLLASLVTTEQRLLNLRTGGSESSSTELERLEQEAFTFTQQHAALIEHIETTYPNYYKLKYNVEVATPERLQASGLDEETALIEYMIGDKDVFIFTVSTTDFDITAVPRNPGLEHQVAELRRGIVEQNFETYTANARALYVQLLEPVIHTIQARSLLIVPDGILNYVPFESLLTEAPTHSSDNNYSRLPYLISDYGVSYAYSSTLLIETRNRERLEPDRDFVAFAPVAADGLLAGSPGADLLQKYALAGAAHPAKWGYLPMTRVEVTQIKALFTRTYSLFERIFTRRVDVYLGDDARESQLTSDELSRYRYVHFATHGFADPSSPESSGIVLFSTPKAVAADDSTSLHDGDPSWSEDGVLRLDEVYALRLNADVVVLSACETGVGPVARGEGILSLARGFLYAGASNVVASLWKADDMQTQKLMLGFYQNMLDGSSTSSSLRTAKLDLIRGSSRYARPYYWATFVLIGA